MLKADNKSYLPFEKKFTFFLTVTLLTPFRIEERSTDKLRPITSTMSVSWALVLTYFPRLHETDTSVLSAFRVLIRWAVYRTDHLIISLKLPLLFIDLFIYLLYIFLISNHFFVGKITWKWLNQMPWNLAHICIGICTKDNNVFNIDLYWWRHLGAIL